MVNRIWSDLSVITRESALFSGEAEESRRSEVRFNCWRHDGRGL